MFYQIEILFFFDIIILFIYLFFLLYIYAMFNISYLLSSFNFFSVKA